MFNIFKRKPLFEVQPTIDGKFAIVEQGGNYTNHVATYTRRRDAVRGATRRGITLANA